MNRHRCGWETGNRTYAVERLTRLVRWFIIGKYDLRRFARVEGRFIGEYLLVFPSHYSRDSEIAPTEAGLIYFWISLEKLPVLNFSIENLKRSWYNSNLHRENYT